MSNYQEFILTAEENTDRCLRTWARTMFLNEYEVVGYQVVKKEDEIYKFILVKY